MKFIIHSSLFLLLAACNNRKDEKVNASADSLPGKTVTAVNTDTLFVTKDAAVFYSPDSLHLAQWKKELGEEDFSTVADDWSYYMMTSQEYLAKDQPALYWTLRARKR